jgi:hypothetical protein
MPRRAAAGGSDKPVARAALELPDEALELADRLPEGRVLGAEPGDLGSALEGARVSPAGDAIAEGRRAAARGPSGSSATAQEPASGGVRTSPGASLRRRVKPRPAWRGGRALAGACRVDEGGQTVIARLRRKGSDTRGLAVHGQLTDRGAGLLRWREVPDAHWSADPLRRAFDERADCPCSVREGQPT